MIITKTYKSIAVALLLSFSTSVFAQGLSCKDMLTEVSAESLAKQEVEIDIQALEIVASIALAFELKSWFANIPLISYRGIRTGRYKSVPRIKYSERGQWSFKNYNFNSITPEDKRRILEDLPQLMDDLLRKSGIKGVRRHRLGREFDKRFSFKVTEDLLARNEEILEDFLEDSFKTIVFNAAKMPKLPRITKLFLFLQRGWKATVPLAAAAGIGTELFYPSAFFQIFLNGDQMFFQDQLYSSIDYMLGTKMLINSTALYPVLAIPTGFITHGRERFNAFDYAYSEGENVRKDYVNAIVDPQD